VACGVTVDEAERAADALAADGVRARVVDCYSVTVVALLALTVTSVVRAPNEVWTIVLPAVAAVVLALLVSGLVRGRRRSGR
jgi:hypothetical protein